jgi:predicted nucleic acid-binding protein
METVVPTDTPSVVPEDPDDDKFIAVAICANADAIITNDRCVLQVDPQCGVRILRPSEFLNTHGLSVSDGDAT